MNVERYLWQKQVMVATPQPYLLRPGMIACSEASSPNYHHDGIRRHREKDWYVFQYTISGSGVFRHKDMTYSIGAGTGFLTSPGNTDISYYYPQESQVPWRFLFMTFKDVGNYVVQINEDSRFVFELSPDAPVIKRMVSIGEISGATVEMRAGEASLLIQQLLATLIDAARPDRHQTQMLHLMRQATRCIEENLSVPYNAGMLADDLDISHAHLCRVFRKELNITPLTFLNRIKVRAACQRLRSTSQSCREVAEGVGFEPGSHFARLFKRMQGMTPNEFRKSRALTL